MGKEEEEESAESSLRSSIACDVICGPAQHPGDSHANKDQPVTPCKCAVAPIAVPARARKPEVRDPHLKSKACRSTTSSVLRDPAGPPKTMYTRDVELTIVGTA